MYAIAFDMVIADLKEHYGEPYNNAYFEIKSVLREYEFYNTQGSVYLTQQNDMANLYRVIEVLKKIISPLETLGCSGWKIGATLQQSLKRVSF